jgi:hypothetical protein
MKKPSIENRWFWHLQDSSLKFIIEDCKLAMSALKTIDSQHPKIGKYADEINDACTVMYYRKNK